MVSLAMWSLYQKEIVSFVLPPYVYSIFELNSSSSSRRPKRGVNKDEGEGEGVSQECHDPDFDLINLITCLQRLF